jgi:hypothetical protein
MLPLLAICINRPAVDYAALYHADTVRAITLVAAMTEPQRMRQALAYAARRGYHGLEIDLATVLAAWQGA